MILSDLCEIVTTSPSLTIKLPLTDQEFTATVLRGVAYEPVVGERVAVARISARYYILGAA